MGELANAAAETKMVEATPQRDIKALLKSQWSRIEAVIPEHMSGERLYQIAVSTINTTPRLAECSAMSICSCVMKCAALGLEPSAVDGLGRAYIVPYHNKKTGGYEATFILGYKGIIDLARRSGDLKSIHAQAVYKGDEFEHWEDETGQHFKFKAADVPHVPDNLTDVYCNAQLMSGGFVFETMSKAEVEAIRKRSKASTSGPWVTDYEAMALKTVIRKASKYLPMSVEAQSAVAADETTPDYSAVLAPVFDEKEE
jgi:recombination protein RecT